ncbi:MAG: hypothetical protein OEY23_12295, partial [Acidimicrobiia bacterium]|nr:hypothetical protein [Acidimicrobiia bacterium]
MRRGGILATLLLIGSAACSGGSAERAEPAPDTASAATVDAASPTDAARRARVDFEAWGGVGHVAAIGLAPGALVTLELDGQDRRPATADESGTALWRDLPPRRGDVVRSDGTRTPVQVLDGSEAVPEDVYDQALGEGYGYVQTRDGTTLAIYVT